jgi:hypothetical protein
VPRGEVCRSGSSARGVRAALRIVRAELTFVHVASGAIALGRCEHFRRVEIPDTVESPAGLVARPAKRTRVVARSPMELSAIRAGMKHHFILCGLRLLFAISRNSWRPASIAAGSGVRSISTFSFSTVRIPTAERSTTMSS